MEPAETVFEQVLELAMAERAAFLDRECAGDSALRERVQKLVDAHERAERLEFLQTNRVPVPTEALGDRIDRYKLLEKIGEGGCGVVYVAEQTEPVRRRVALKVIKLGMDTKAVVARFEAERQALAMMDHPNIAKVLDAGSTDTGRPFFVMELVRGTRITDYCDQANLKTSDRLDLLIKVCQAIQHAHQKGIIHRDIKPSNILVTLHDGVPVPKVIDFGIAKATTGQRLTEATLFTAFEQFMGTPAYMSPEQAEMSGLDIDTRSDIYSLGVLLYELLTGQALFDGQVLMASGIDAMRKTIREKEPVRPSTRLTQELIAAGVSPPKSSTGLAIPSEAEASAVSRRRQRLKEQINRLRGDLDWIVMKCLEKDRSRRYDTANDVAADLHRHLNNEPVVARPPSAAYKLQKAWRRNKLAFTATTAVAIALLVGITVSTWLAFEARRARDAEKNHRLAAQKALLKADAEERKAQYELYVARMHLAGQAWEQGNYEELRKLLAATRDSPDRGFEWDYWQRQVHLNLKTLRGHLRSVNSVAFSPDGQRIVTGSDDQTARVWDASSGRELFKLLGHKSGITSAAFSPNGQRIITGSHDQTARVWDSTTQRELFKLMGHSAGISGVAFSPDGQRIVTASYDQTARVWDADSGRELHTLVGHTNAVYSVAFSPDGLWIVTGGHDGTARIWDAATGRALRQIKGHRESIYAVAFSPDSLRVVTGSHLLTAQVWDVATARELLKLTGHAPISSVAFSPDGRRIVTGSWDSTASVWDAVNGDNLHIIRGHVSSVFSVAYSPDSRRIVTAGGDAIAKVWEASGEREPLLLQGNSPDILAVAISPDGQRIATGGGILGENANATGTNQAAQLWERSSGKKLLTLDGHSSGISSMAFSPDGLWIVTGSGDQTARVWDAATGRQIHKLEGHKGVVNSVAFSPDNQRIVTAGQDRTAKVWDAATGRRLLDLVGHTAQVRSAAFSPDGHRIVTGGDDFTARVWDAATGRQVRPLQSTNIAQILSVAFSPDGQRLVVGGWHRVALVWDMATGRELFTLMGHMNPVCAVAFSPDGKRIVTVSYAGSAKLWDAATGRELLTLNVNRDGLTSVAFSSDGHGIVTGSPSLGDGTARVWEAAGAGQVAAWEEEEGAAAETQDRWQRELAVLLREQADEEKRQRITLAHGDEGAIKRWLILGPIELAPDKSGAEGLKLEQINGEGQLRPKAGKSELIGSGEFKWRELAGEDYVIDFNAFLEHVKPHSVAYAGCYIQSEIERHGLRMLLFSKDAAKVFLNGKQVHQAPFPRSFFADQHKVQDISLNAGLNALVFKVVNENGDWQGSLRLTDAEGNPVQGIRVTLDPDAQNAP